MGRLQLIEDLVQEVVDLNVLDQVAALDAGRGVFAEGRGRDQVALGFELGELVGVDGGLVLRKVDLPIVDDDEAAVVVDQLEERTIWRCAVPLSKELRGGDDGTDDAPRL